MTIPPHERPRPQPRSPSDKPTFKDRTETATGSQPGVQTETQGHTHDDSHLRTKDNIQSSSLTASQSKIEFASSEQLADDSDECTQDYLSTSSQDSGPSLKEGFDDRFVRDSIRSRLFGQSDPTFRIGEFVVFQKIGQGGGGAVYAAYDDKLGRKVALKFLLSEPKRSATSQARLVREAQAMARLSHPNVVQVYSLHELEGEIFLAMEIVEGQSVKDWLDQKPRQWQEVLNIYIQAGRGLSAAHRAGLIHRDFKPSNVMIQHDGRVCVGDFGCASFQDSVFFDDKSQTLTNGTIFEGDEDTQETVPVDTGDSSVYFNSRNVALTQTGTTLGTLAYMAPEQLERKTANEHSDQYSFCVALYEGLYGKRPQIGDVCGSRDAPSKSHVPQSIYQALRRGLSPHPQDRFADIDELLEALRYQKHRSRRRTILTGIFASALMASPFVYIAQRDDLEDPCSVYEQEFTEFVSPQLADRLEVAFSNSGNPFADESRKSLKRATHRYADQWNETGNRLCDASNASPQDRARFDAQAECLERRQDELQHVLEIVLDQQSESRMDKAVIVVNALPKPEQCEYAKALQGSAGDRFQSAPAQTKPIRDLISKSRAFWHTGNSDSSMDFAQQALERSQNLVHGPLIAESLYLIGRLQASTAEITTAKETLLQAADLAEADHHDDLAVDIWLQLLHLANREGIHSSAQLHFRRANAAIKRLEENGERRASILDAMAYADQQAGNLNASLQGVAIALEIRQSVPIPNPLPLSRSYWTKSYILDLLGDTQASLETMQVALEIQVEELGLNHPSVASAHHGLGILQMEAGEFEAAQFNFSRALTIRNHQSDRRTEPKILIDLANAALALHQGDPKKCNQATKYILDEMRDRYPTNDPRFADPLRLLGQSEIELNHYQDALPSFESAIDILRTSGSKNYIEIARNLSSIARSLVHLDQYELAQHHLTEALSLIRRKYVTSHRIETAEFQSEYAVSLYKKGKPIEACTVLEKASRNLARFPKTTKFWIKEARQYIDQCKNLDTRSKLSTP